MGFLSKLFGAPPPKPELAEPPVTAPPVPAPTGASPKRLLSYRAANLQGIGRRARQEDSFTLVNAMDVTEIRKNGLLAVVADGMGGMRDGRIASTAVIQRLKADFPALDRNNPAEGLRESLLRAGGDVFSRLGGDGGSTAVVCLFYEEKLWYAGVGDSSVYLLRDGELLQMSREMNVRNERFLETLRSGSTDPAAGREDPETAALTGFLGMEELEDVDLFRRPLPLREGDVLLLCSDGVSGVLSGTELRDALSLPAPQAACDAMERSVLSAANPYQDNFTALVIQCVK